jgi:hydroxyethylthiazole kinase
MQTITWDTPFVRQVLASIQTHKPFIYGLTNYVAATLSANVLLAVGAGPAIGPALDWPEHFASGARGVWINAAALMSADIDALERAARAADQAGTPWVLDPVAVGAGAPVYDAAVRGLLVHSPTVIRGNASELIAFSGGDATGEGVETTAQTSEALGAIASLSRQAGAIVAVSGATDYVASGDEIFAIPGGDARLTKVTGAGCALGALIAAALGAHGDPLEATLAAHALYAEAAARASGQARGSASFATAFVDQLSLLDPELNAR